MSGARQKQCKDVSQQGIIGNKPQRKFWGTTKYHYFSKQLI